MLSAVAAAARQQQRQLRPSSLFSWSNDDPLLRTRRDTRTAPHRQVLFGAPLDGARYDATLDACALRADLLIVPGGDMAEIGERGINLSGGQKARVAPPPRREREHGVSCHT